MQSAHLDAGSREDKQQELDHLLHSGVVRERTQLHSLLAYLGTKAIEEPAEPLKEYTIGVEALGKSGDYDPRLDPTIRVEVAKLRRRLKEYYQEAGAERPVKLEIPKGVYLPVFSSASTPARTGRSVPRSWGFWLAAVAVIASVAAIAVGWSGRRGNTARLAPELEAFWEPHFSERTPTLLVLGAPMFYRTAFSFYRATRVNRPEDLEGNPEAQEILSILKPQEPHPVYHFVGIGEAEALFHITRLLAGRGAPLMVERSSTVGWQDLKGRHAIFLGGRKFNPQIPEFPYKAKFEAVERRIVNLEPKAGEPSEYLSMSLPPNGDITEKHALISVYPGFTPNTRFVTLECSSTEGTLAAAEFLIRPDMLAQLISRRIPLRPERGVYRSFQVVIAAKFNKGVVVGLSYKTHRVLN
ncbi:MAG: hypothetical protein HY822_24930 [Acidobacteria bacterium]|nr:hypothetical protein [Acidobacteriota bacterium]